MSKNGKKFVCIFDASHFVDSEDKLARHMLKCKAMEKDSYLCCKFNPIHWVKHYDIGEHQQNCPDKNKVTKPPQNSFSKVLPQDISQYEFTLPFEIDMSMVQSSSAKSSNKSAKKQQSKGQIRDLNFVEKKQKQHDFKKAKKVQLWVEPDIEDFLRRKGYRADKNQVASHRNRPQSFMAHDDSLFC